MCVCVCVFYQLFIFSGTRQPILWILWIRILAHVTWSPISLILETNIPPSLVGELVILGNDFGDISILSSQSDVFSAVKNQEMKDTTWTGEHCQTQFFEKEWC